MEKWFLTIFNYQMIIWIGNAWKGMNQLLRNGINIVAMDLKSLFLGCMIMRLELRSVSVYPWVCFLCHLLFSAWIILRRENTVIVSGNYRYNVTLSRSDLVLNTTLMVSLSTDVPNVSNIFYLFHISSIWQFMTLIYIALKLSQFCSFN